MSEQANVNPLFPGTGPTYSKLYRLLTETQQDRLTDEQLADACGHPCRVGGKAYGTLCRVIKAVEKTGRTWRRELKAGCIRRLTEAEKLGHVSDLGKRAGRIVKRGAIVVGTIDPNQLTNEQRVEANAKHALLGSMAMFLTPATEKKLEARQAETPADAAAVFNLIIGKKQQLKLAE